MFLVAARTHIHWSEGTSNRVKVLENGVFALFGALALVGG
jgi:hypothetical protein